MRMPQNGHVRKIAIFICRGHVHIENTSVQSKKECQSKKFGVFFFYLSEQHKVTLATINSIHHLSAYFHVGHVHLSN